MTMHSEKEFYNTIDRTATAEYKDRGSNFIAYAFPVVSADDFKKNIQQIKKDHPKAVHHCFAYRLGTDMNNFRSSDDGEPSGSAGKPILGQIDSKQMTNVMVVVVRYFGGTLLGVPGLINAYKTATALVLQMVPMVHKAIEVPYQFQFEYQQLNEIMRLLKKCNASVIKQEMNLFPEIVAGIPKSREEELLMSLKDLHNVKFTSLVCKN